MDDPTNVPPAGIEEDLNGSRPSLHTKLKGLILRSASFTSLTSTSNVNLNNGEKKSKSDDSSTNTSIFSFLVNEFLVYLPVLLMSITSMVFFTLTPGYGHPQATAFTRALQIVVFNLTNFPNMIISAVLLIFVRILNLPLMSAVINCL